MRERERERECKPLIRGKKPIANNSGNKERERERTSGVGESTTKEREREKGGYLFRVNDRERLSGWIHREGERKMVKS